MAGQSGAGALEALLLGSRSADGTVTGVASGTSQPIDCSLRQDLVGYLTGSAALSAGTLIFEEAYYDPNREPIYSGTWSQINSTTLATPFASAGGQYAIHFTPSAYKWVRARVGTGVVGGTLAVVLVGN